MINVCKFVQIVNNAKYKPCENIPLYGSSCDDIRGGISGQIIIVNWNCYSNWLAWGLSVL